MAPCPRHGGLDCESEEGWALGRCVQPLLSALAYTCDYPLQAPAFTSLHRCAITWNYRSSTFSLPSTSFCQGIFFYHNNKYNTRTVSHWAWSPLIHSPEDPPVPASPGNSDFCVLLIPTFICCFVLCGLWSSNSGLRGSTTITNRTISRAPWILDYSWRLYFQTYLSGLNRRWLNIGAS